MKWWFGLLLFAGGCDFVFRLDHINAVDGGGDGRGAGDAVDAIILPEQPAFCDRPVILDPFDDPGMVCAWGAMDKNGTAVSVHDSVLEVQLDGTQATFGGCTAFASLPFTAAGAFLVVPQALLVSNAYTKLGVRSVAGAITPFDATIASDGASIRFYVNNNPVGQATTMAYTWWRIDQPTTGRVDADVSTNGVDWTNLATITLPAPQQINIDIGAGINGLPSEAGSATLATFGVCN